MPRKSRLPMPILRRAHLALSSGLGPVLGLALPLLLGSCGGKVQSALTCGTGDKIAFGYQSLTGDGRLEGGEKVQWENGVELFVVDESCRYWTYYWTDKESTWSETRSGTLNADQLSRLNSSVYQRDWPANPKSQRVVDASGVQFLWRQEEVASCHAVCADDTFNGLVVNAQGLLRELYAAGNPPDRTAPMRWIVVESQVSEGLLDVYPIEPWTGPTPLAEVAILTDDRAAYLALTFGGHALVPAETVGAIRDFRRTLLDQKALPTFSSMMFLEGGRTYDVNARDALPIENEAGLVRPPGVPDVLP